jgi:TP901 family phage tail tape measure protein
MAMNQFGVGMIFKGVDAVSPVARKVSGALFGMRKDAEMSMTGMNRAMTGAVVGFKAMQAGFGMAGAAKSLADAAGTFEQKMASIGVISGATGDQLRELHDTAIEAALATQFSPDEAADGLQRMAAMGLTAEESMTALTPVLDLAAGSLGQLGLADAANAVVGTLKAFGEEADNAAVVTDKLLRITQLSNFQARDFGVGLSRAASTAKLFGQSLDDALIQMGLLRNMNIEASVASTSLREAWRRLAADAKAQQVVQSKGVDIFDKSTGKTRQLMDVMTDLAEKTKDLTDKERNRIAVQAFGVRGMAAFNAVAEARTKAMIDGVEITLEGADAVGYLRKEMEGAAGAAAHFREKLLDTYDGQKTLIEGSKQALATVTGEAAAKLFKPLASMTFQLYSGLANLMKAIPMGARQAIIGLITGFGAILGSAGAVIAFSAAIKFLGLSLGGVVLILAKLALFVAPAMLLVSGLVAGITAVVKAFKSSSGGLGGLGGWLKGWAKNIKAIWSGVNEVMARGFLTEKTTKRMKKAGQENLIPVIRTITEWVHRLRTFWDGLKVGWMQAIDELQPKIEVLKDTFGGIFERFLFDGAGPKDSMDKWREAGQGAGKEIGKLGGIFIDWLTESAPMIEELLNSLKGLTADDIKGGITAVVDTFRTMLDIFNRIEGVLRVITNLFDLIGSSIGENIGGFARYVQMMTGGMSMKEYYRGRKYANENSESMRALEELQNAWELTTTGKDPATEAMRERNMQLEGMVERYRKIREGMDTSAADWNRKGQAFEEMSPAMREQQVAHMNRLADSINKLANKPLVAKVTIDEVGRSSQAYADREADRELYEGGMSIPNY